METAVEEVDFKDIFDRSKANNYSFASNSFANWKDDTQEIDADFFLSGNRNKDEILTLFYKISKQLGITETNLTKSSKSKLVLPASLLYDKNLMLDPKNIDYFVGRATLEVLIQKTLGHSGYTNYNKAKEESKKGNVEALVAVLVFEECVQKKLADQYPGYSKYFEKYRKEVQANNFDTATSNDEEVLSLFNKMLRYPGAITAPELKKHEGFVKAISKYFNNHRVPKSSNNIKKMADSLYQIMMDYLIDPPDENPPPPPPNPSPEDKPSEPDDPGEREGASDGSSPEDKSSDEESKESKDDEKGESSSGLMIEESDKEAEEAPQDKENMKFNEELKNFKDTDVSIVSKANWKKAPKRTAEEVKKSLETITQNIAQSKDLENAENDKKYQSRITEELKNSINSFKKRNKKEIKKPEKAKSFSPTTYVSKKQILRDPEVSMRTKGRYARLDKEAPLGKANVLRNKLNVKIKNYEFIVKGAKQGHLDPNKIAEAVQGIETVYEQIGTVTTNKVSVGILIDESGSMGTTYMETAIKAALMLHHAIGKQDNINLFIYGHHSNGQNCVVTRYIEPGFGRVSNLGASVSCGANYDGDAIAKCSLRMREKTKDPILFFVISDGAPSASNYGGSKAISHVKKVVDFMERHNDMTIVQIAIQSRVPSEQMFQQFIELINLETLPSDLSNYVTAHLDKKLKTKVTF